MGEEETKSHAFSLLNGNYTAIGNWYSSIVVNGNKGVLKEPTNSKLKMKIKLGDFGEADPEIYKTTGQKSYNIEFLYSFGKDYTELGVVSEDGLKITTKGMMGVTVLEWMTDKEAEALEEDVEGDPIKAPPGPYTIQPDNLGKFLWITGAPGLGKSTSAQLLSKNYGYVYYEGDCFGKCRNPYISSDVTNATMAVLSQKLLKGEGLDARMEQCKKAVGMFMGILNGKEFDLEVAKEFYSCMCDDIISERKRIGGDWVIADAAFTRNLRDHIRRTYSISSSSTSSSTYRFSSPCSSTYPYSSPCSSTSFCTSYSPVHYSNYNSCTWSVLFKLFCKCGHRMHRIRIKLVNTTTAMLEVRQVLSEARLNSGPILR